MLRQNLTVAALALGLSVALAAPCRAQSSSMFGGRGPTSSGASGIRGSSGSSAYGLSSGSQAMSGFSASQAGFGSSASISPFGAQQFGVSQMGAAGLARTTGANGLQPTGSANGQGGLYGQSSRFGVSSTGGRLGQTRFGQSGLLGQNRNRNGLNQNQGQGQNQQDDMQNTNVRIRPQVSFPYDSRVSESVNVALASQFRRIGQSNPDFGDIQFTMDDRSEVTLTGTVPREHAGRLAAALIRLEPGVRSVRNELTVAAP